MLVDLVSLLVEILLQRNDVHERLFDVFLRCKLKDYFLALRHLYVPLRWRDEAKSKDIVPPELLHDEVFIIVGCQLSFGNSAKGEQKFMGPVSLVYLCETDLIELYQFFLHGRHVQNLADDDLIAASVTQTTHAGFMNLDGFDSLQVVPQL